MKKRILNILTVASILTTIGFIMDGDVKEPSMLMRFVEFILMIGIVFTLLFFINYTFNLAKKSLQKV